MNPATRPTVLTALMRPFAVALVSLLVVAMAAPAAAAGASTNPAAGASTNPAAGAGTNPAAAGAAVTTRIQPIAPACADAPAGRFLDVSGVHQPGVDCIGWWGIAQGSDDQRFRPELPVRREQMASFLARAIEAAGVELSEFPPRAFEDTDTSSHVRSIDRLAEIGVVGGVSPTRFDPAGTVTRAQMASFLARAYEAVADEPLADEPLAGDPPPANPASFPDIAGNVHADNILRLADAGLTSGLADGRYDPAGVVTRGQMGTFLARLLALLVVEGHLDATPTNPVDLPDLSQLMPPIPDPDPTTGHIEVPAVEPTILTSVNVEVAPGQTQHIRQPVDPRVDRVHYWFHDGRAEDYRSSQCAVVGGQGVRISAQVVAAGQETDSSSGWMPGAEDCMAGTAWAFSFDDEPEVLDELDLLIHNTGTTTFRSRVHVGQPGRFSTAGHRAGTTATYVFTTVSRDELIRGLDYDHPVAAWDLDLDVAEPTTLRLFQDPFVRPCDGVELCSEFPPAHLSFVHAVDASFSNLGSSLVVHPGRCEYRMRVDGPGTVSGGVRHNDQFVLEVEPAS